jgi:hypothetical protein
MKRDMEKLVALFSLTAAVLGTIISTLVNSAG